MIIFLFISLNMCFECSKEPSHRDGSFGYPQQLFWVRNKKYNLQLRTLIRGIGILFFPDWILVDLLFYLFSLY